jgi:hypothetical protein
VLSAGDDHRGLSRGRYPEAAFAPTPLRPRTILSAHVAAKLLLSAVTLLSLILVGKRFYSLGGEVHLASFLLALVVSTLSILSIVSSSPALSPRRASRSRSAPSFCIR